MKDIKKTSIKMSHFTIGSTFKHSQNKKVRKISILKSYLRIIIANNKHLYWDIYFT